MPSLTPLRYALGPMPYALRIIELPKRQQHSEDRAAAVTIAGGDLAAQHVHEVPHDRQTQPRAAGSRARLVHSIKPFKDPAEILGGYSGPGIRDDQPVPAFVQIGGYGDDTAVRRVADGVFDQVPQDVMQLRGIDDERLRIGARCPCESAASWPGPPTRSPP